MAQAETNVVALRVSEEGSWAPVPSSPTMQYVRWTGGSLVHNKDTVLSATLRSDRMVDDIAEVMARSEGDVNMELSFGLDATPDPVEQGLLMMGALGTTDAQLVQGGEGPSETIACTAATGTFTGTATTWQTDGLLPGMWILFDGFANGVAGTRGNNGPHQVATVSSDTVLTVVDKTILAEEDPGPGSQSYCFNNMRNGIEKRSYLLELGFADVTQFMSFRGMRVNRMELNVTSGQIATISFSFMGQRGIIAQTTVAGSTDLAPTFSVMNATSNVGTLYEGLSPLATAIRSISLTVDNAGRNLAAVANKYAIGINLGRQSVTGTMEAYFEDEVFVEKYIDHTETSLSIPFNDAAGNWIIFTVPSMYFSEGSPNVPGIDEEVMQTLNFSARREPTNQLYQVQVDYLPAF